MVEIVSCPQCGRPRAAGHRCPSCGDTSAATDQRASIPDPAQSWQQPAGPGGQKGRGRVVMAVAATAVIVAAIVVAVLLTRGGGEVAEDQASPALAAATASDLAAEQLIRNAMTTLDTVAVEAGGYERINQSTLQTMEPGIEWVQGSAGLYASPPAGTEAKQSSVAWAVTGALSYELGTWSATGMAVGVRVDMLGGGITYYRDGQAGAW